MNPSARSDRTERPGRFPAAHPAGKRSRSACRRANASMACDNVAGEAGTTIWPQFRQITWPGPCIKRRESIVDLGDRADSAAAGVPAMRLAKRDRGGDALDRSASGLSSLARNCRVYGEKVSTYAPLALGEERVEGQRTLACSAYPGDRRSAGRAAGRGRNPSSCECEPRGARSFGIALPWKRSTRAVVSLRGSSHVSLVSLDGLLQGPQ